MNLIERRFHAVWNCIMELCRCFIKCKLWSVVEVIVHYFQLIQNLIRELISDVVWYVMSVEAMPIANWEKVQALYSTEIRSQDKAILILFEGIPWYEAYSCGKGELSYDIVSAVSLISWCILRFCLKLSFRGRLLLLATAVRRLPYWVILVSIGIQRLATVSSVMVCWRVRLLSEVASQLFRFLNPYRLWNWTLVRT